MPELPLVSVLEIKPRFLGRYRSSATGRTVLEVYAHILEQFKYHKTTLTLLGEAFFRFHEFSAGAAKLNTGLTLCDQIKYFISEGENFSGKEVHRVIKDVRQQPIKLKDLKQQRLWIRKW